MPPSPPHRYEPHFNLGSVLESAGLYSQAIKAYKGVLELAPDNVEVMKNLAQMPSGHPVTSRPYRRGSIAPHLQTIEAFALRPHRLLTGFHCATARKGHGEEVKTTGAAYGSCLASAGGWPPLENLVQCL